MTELTDIITVPYLPVLGPVHPLEITEHLLEAIADTSVKNILLPYDKAFRWGSIPTERVLTGGISGSGDSSLTVSTATQNGKTKLYVYGDSQIGVEDDSDEVITFSVARRPLGIRETSQAVFIDDFMQLGDSQFDGSIHFLNDLLGDPRDNLSHLAADPSVRGLLAAYDMDAAEPGKFPTLAYVQDGEVRGAIGPLNVLADSRGVKRLLPCYFIVQPELRRSGIGAKLWSAMRIWARDNAADYKILQAEAESPAEKFYLSQGLRCLGYVYRKRRD